MARNSTPQAFARYGHESPKATAEFIVTLLDSLLLFAVVGAVLWLIVHHGQLWKFRSLPIFYFTFLMVMYQKFHSHYFWYPRERWVPNMHDAYWAMLALMGVTAFFCRKPYATKTDEEMAKLPWGRLAVGTAMIYILVLATAGLWVNKDGKTMGAANTRFPMWPWSDGPFPGRE